MPVLERTTLEPGKFPEYVFDRPGCGYGHGFKTEGDGPRWTFNGDLDKPTISPSLLVQGQYRCHSFIKDGQIQFLTDCDHQLAGQTVPLQEIE